MIGLRTLALLFLPFAASAEPAFAAEELMRTFATCAGRLSAQMEHEWLLSAPSADQTEAQRDGMVALLDTFATDETARIAMRFRVEAKHAQSVLLNQATFARDQRAASRAARRAEAQISACRALLIS